MNEPELPNRREVLRLGWIAVAYFFAHQIAYLFRVADAPAIAIWPVGGVGLAILLLNPRRLWPSIGAVFFLTSAAVNLIVGRQFAANVGFVTANVLECVVSAWLISRWCGERVRFNCVRDVLALLVAVVGVNFGTALIGAATASAFPAAASAAGATTFWQVWRIWWVSDGLGLLLIAPLIVGWVGLSNLGRIRLPWIRILELAAFLMVLSLAVWLMLSSYARERFHIPPQPSGLIVLIIWSALRFGLRGVTATMIVFAVVMVNSEQVRHGPLLWGGANLAERLLLAQTYMAFVTVAGLLLAAGSAENKSARVSITALAARHQTLLETGSDGVHVLDAAGNVVEANKAFCRMLGYSRDEILRLNVMDFNTETSREELLVNIQRLIAQPSMLETVHRRKDGTLLHVEIDAVGVMLEGRNLLYASSRDITARKQAEAALKETQERLVKTMDQAHLAYWKMDRATESFTFNDRFYALYGTTAEREGGYRMPAEVYARALNEARLRRAERVAGIGNWQIDLTTRKATSSINARKLYGLGEGEMTLADLQAVALPVYREHLDEALRALIEDDQPYDVEFQIRRRTDGQVVDIHSLAEYDRATQTVFGVIHDVTEYKRINAALRESEAKFAKVFRDAPVWIAITDLVSAAYIEVNDQVLRDSGFSREEMIGHTPVEIGLVTATNRTPVVDGIRKLGRVADVEMTFRTKDGRVLYGLLTGEQIVLDGRLCLLTVTVDITARKQTEAALLVSEEKFATVFRDAPMGMAIRDSETGRYLDSNDQCLALTGYDRDEVIGRTPKEIGFWMDDPDLHGNQGQVAAKDGVNEREMRLRQKSGRIITCSQSTHAIQLGGRSCSLSITLDITARKQAEEALRASLQEKEALLKEVHHRVKNNLQVVTSLLRLESGRSAQPDTKSVLGDMQGRIRSMALLHESLYRAGTFAAVDLGTYLRQIATQGFRTLVTTPGTIQLKLDLASLAVELDQAMPCGLLVNELVTNSLKHGFPGGRTGEVRVELLAIDGGPRGVSLRVSDTGVGLPADFEAKRDHSLGLQLVADLTRQLGGKLEIGAGEPGAGTGASFTVSFTPQRSAES